jgi:hypothetical protein
MRATTESVLACCWPADAADLPEGMFLRGSFYETGTTAIARTRLWGLVIVADYPRRITSISAKLRRGGTDAR